MTVPWFFPFGNRGASESPSKSEQTKNRKGRRKTNPSTPPIFELTQLEQRILLSFSPGISGPATLIGGQSLLLNLNHTGTSQPFSWTINWGDNSTPEVVAGTNTSWPHLFKNVAGSYKVTASAKIVANGIDYPAQPLGLDTSLVSSTTVPGTLVTDFGAFNESGYATVVDSQNRIVVAGVSSTSTIDGNIAVLRYNSDGTLDTLLSSGFGPTNQAGTARLGYATLNLGQVNGVNSTERAYAVAIQSDGKIVVAGTTNLNGSTAGNDFVVARFTQNGILDIALSDGFGTSNGTARKGFTTIDFGATGSVSNDQVNAMTIDSSGRIVVAGSASRYLNAFAVARLDSFGQLDTTFNSSGTKLVAFPNASVTTSCQAILIETDPSTNVQTILLGGYAYGVPVSGQSQTTDFALTRLNFNGSLDDGSAGDQYPSDYFGPVTSKGFVLTDFSAGTGGSSSTAPSTDADFTLVLEPDLNLPGNFAIVAGGSATPNNGPSDFAAARYTKDGQLDTDGTTGFGPPVANSSLRAGKVTIDFAGGTDVAYASAVDANGKILLAGLVTSSSLNGTGTDFGIVRLNIDGNLDPTFGAGGKQTIDFAPSTSGAATSTDAARSMSLTPDGKIVVAGYVQIGTNQMFALARYQPTNSITVSGLPDVPANFKVTGARAGKVDLSWSSVYSATSYLVERSIDGGNTWQVIGSPTATTFSDTTTVDGGVYSYRIRAVSSVGLGLVPTDNARVQIAAAVAAFKSDSFEAPLMIPGSFQIAPAGSPFTMVQQPLSTGGSGIANHSSTLYTSQTTENAPNGQQEAYLQGNGIISLSQSMTGGHYTVSFQSAKVAGSSGNQVVTLRVDGNTVKTFAITGSGFQTYDASFDLPVGVAALHTIDWVGSGATTAVDAALIDDVRLQPLGCSEGEIAPLTFTNVTVPSAGTNPTVSITWDVGTVISGTITKNADGTYRITGSHQYNESGTFNVQINVADSNGVNRLTLNTQAFVTDPPLQATIKPLTVAVTAPLSGTILRFADPVFDPSPYFSGTVNWGDNTAGAVTVTRDVDGAFSVVVNSASGHIYNRPGSYSVTVTVSDEYPSTPVSFTVLVLVKDGSLSLALPASNPLPGATTLTEGDSFNGTLLELTDSNTSSVAADYKSVNVVWDTGSAVATLTSMGMGTGKYTITTSDLKFNHAGVIPVTVTVTGMGGTVVTQTIFANVKNASTPTTPASPSSMVEGIQSSIQVATFTDPNSEATANDFLASVDWGDGSVAPATITKTSSLGASPSTFTVIGDHVYSIDGTKTVTVKISGANNTPLITTFTMTVNEAALTAGTSPTMRANPGTTFSGTVGTFTDANLKAVATDFTAVVIAPDGTTPITTSIVVNPAGGFFVNVTGLSTVAGANFAVTVHETDSTVNLIAHPALVLAGAESAINLGSQPWRTTPGYVDLDSTNHTVTLREFTGVETTARTAIVVPSGASQLTFQYQTSFDVHNANYHFMNDAFEVALVDSNGAAILPGYSTGRDAFLNITSGQTTVPSVYLTPASTVTNGTVKINLTGVTGGTYDLVLRLVGNDTDTNIIPSQQSWAQITYSGSSTSNLKFYVGDAATTTGVNDTLYRYDSTFHSIDASPPNLVSSNILRGVATNAAGDRVWEVDNTGKVYVYNSLGQALGSWIASGPVHPQGIAVHGQDVFIVDAWKFGPERGTGQIYVYRNAASALSGTLIQSNLSSPWGLFVDTTGDVNGNTQPTDIAADGNYIWVTDANQHRIFRYLASNGSTSGHFQLDPTNTDPTGVTVSSLPGSNDIWVVDKTAQKVFHYANSKGYTDGSPHIATDVTPLAGSDTDAQAIAIVDATAAPSLATPAVAASGGTTGSQTASVSLNAGNTSTPRGPLAPVSYGGSATPATAPATPTGIPTGTSEGHEFWLAVLPTNTDGTPHPLLTLSSRDSDANVTISGEQASNLTNPTTYIPFTFKVVVPRNTSVRINLTDKMGYLPPNFNIQFPRTAIHVTSDQSISVSMISSTLNGSESYLALPVPFLGSQYVALSARNSINNNSSIGSDMAIIATEDNTVVHITPKRTLVGYNDTGSYNYPAGTEYTKSLNKGQVYFVSDSTQGSDLSGTIVTATNSLTSNPSRVVLIGGSLQAQFPDDSVTAPNPVYQELPPVDGWGQNFVTVPLARWPEFPDQPWVPTRTGDTFRILASQATDVTINGSTTLIHLSAGDVVQQILTGPSSINANHPILVTQISNGGNFEGTGRTLGDPAMMLVPATDQYLDHYLIQTGPPGYRDPNYTTYEGFTRHAVNVTVQSSFAGQILIDGVAIPASQFSAIPNTSFSGAVVELAPGSHSIDGPVTFGAITYGYGDFDAYGYPAGFHPSLPQSLTMTLDARVSIEPIGKSESAVATLRSGTNILSGVRINFMVTGANPITGFAYTDDNGVAVFTYSGQISGNDLVTATVDGVPTKFATTNVTWSTFSPTISITSPANNAAEPSGSNIVISGIATPGNPLAPIANVSVNGVPVDTLDAAGHFYTKLHINAGTQTFTFMATDIFGQVATSPLQLNGVTGPGIGSLTDVSSSITSEYGRTSFNDQTHILYADLRLKNTGNSTISAPLSVAVEHISDPSVMLLYTAAPSQAGFPVIGFSSALTGSTLPVAAMTAYQTLAFYNPNNVRFTYDLVPVALNTNNLPPVFSTVPVLRAGIGAPSTYKYAAHADDLNGDAITYRLRSAPNWLTVDSNGLLHAVAASTTPAGSYEVALQAVDSSGAFAEQDFEIVASADANLAPVFSSVPITIAQVGKDYIYNAEAQDPDGDPLTFSLSTLSSVPGVHPKNLTIDATTGVVRWTPTQAEITTGQSVQLYVSDGQGHQAEQDFMIGSVATAAGPHITSQPPTRVAVGAPYVYAVRAAKGSLDRLTFSLVTHPDGMQIDNFGVITWRSSHPAASIPIAVSVQDEHGNSDTQTYSLTVAGTADNHAPYIISQPSSTAVANLLYTYKVQAYDIDSDVLTYTQQSMPAGMTFNAFTSTFSWTPTAVSTGNTVQVTVSDPSGAQVIQRFTIDVINDQNAPIIQPHADFNITAGQPFVYDVVAADADTGDLLTYSINSNPAGMSIDQSGHIRWQSQTTDNTVSGQPKTFNVVVTDKAGKSATQSFAVNLAGDTQPPQVSIQLDGSRSASQGATVLITVSATDNVGVTSLGLAIKYPASNTIIRTIPLDNNGKASVLLSSIGTFTFVATAKDAAQNSASAALDVIVSTNGGASATPVAELTSPLANSETEITSPTSITGHIAASANGITGNYTYSLTATPLEGGTATTLATGAGTDPIAAGTTIGVFDPTLLQNGKYVIALSVTSFGSTSTVQATVDVIGDLKVGNFKFSETDLTIPVAGLPLTVSRNYDSLNTNYSKDFGPGWSLGFDMNIKEGAEQRQTFNFDQADASDNGTRAGTSLSVRQSGDRDVYLTLPGGRRAKFKFEFNASGTAVFTPEAGIHAQLTVQGNAHITGQANYDPNGSTGGGLGGAYWDAQGGPNNFYVAFKNRVDEYDIPGYILTTEDGTQFYFDKTESSLTAKYAGRYIDTNGEPSDSINEYIKHVYDNQNSLHLSKIVDPNGGVLTFTPSGITSSEGPGITFIRDTGTGKITSINDATGQQVVTYGYDAISGDLKSVTRLIDHATPAKTQTTTYNYKYKRVDGLSISTHVIVSILSPSGKMPIVNVYDDVTGKLKSTTDAFGTQIGYNYSVANQETITDQRRGKTTYTYDSKGNVLSSTSPSGTVALPGVSSTYGFADSSSHNVTSETDFTSAPASQQISKTYEYVDALGYRTKETDTIHSVLFDGTGNPIAGPDRTTVQTWHYIDVAGVHVMDLSVDLSVNTAVGTRTENTYDPTNANLLQTLVRNPASLITQKTTFAYDTHGRQTGVTQWIKKNGAAVVAFDSNVGTWVPYVSTLSYYDPNTGYLLETDVQDAGGAKLQMSTFTYDGDGNVIQSTQWKKDASQTWIPFSTSTSAYDAQNRLIKSTDPLSASNQTFYNADGQVDHTLDGYGQTSSSAFDALGRVNQSTDSFGNATISHYDLAGAVVESIYPDGTVSRSTYDTAGRVIWSVDRYKPGTPDLGANGTLTAYDQNTGRVTQTNRYANVVISVTSSGNGLYASSTPLPTVDPFSVTRQDYDGAGRAVRTQTGSLSGTTFTAVRQSTSLFDNAGRQISSTQWTRSGGIWTAYATTQYEYDALGRRTAVIDADVNASDPYDTTTPQRNHRSEMTYDGLGRVIATTSYVLSTAATPAYVPVVMTATYDELGRKVMATDALGRTTSYAYDELGNLMQVTQPMVADPRSGGGPNNPTSRYTYDVEGHLLTQTDALGRQTAFTFDGLSQQTSRTLPDTGRKDSTTYDSHGRMKTHTDFNGQISVNIYDDEVDPLIPLAERTHLGRLVFQRLYLTAAQYAATPNSPTEVVHTQYDDLGRQLSVTDNSGTWGNTYDAEGRLATRSFSAPGIAASQPENTLAYFYDPVTSQHTRTTLTHFTWAAGNNTPLTTKVTEDTQYGYDDLGRLFTVTAGVLGGVAQSPTLVTTYGYDKVGNRTSLQLPNGTYTLYTYDTMNRLIKLQSWLTSVAVANRDDAHAVMVQVYTVGVTGRRDAVHEVFRDDSGTVTANTTTNWYYDALDRLTNETVTNTASGSVELYHTDYTYDLVGNRLEKKTTTKATNEVVDITYQYDTTNGVTHSDDRLMIESETDSLDTSKNYTINYVYDDNGSLTNKNRTGSNPETDVYGYDLRNRMTSSSVTLNPGLANQSVTTTTYGYDPGGLRTGKVVNANGTITSTTYVEDTNNPTGYAQVVEEQNTTTHAINVAYDIGQEVTGQMDVGGVIFLLADGHGSTRLMLKTDGSLLKDVNLKVMRDDYDAFGNAASFDPTTSRTSFLYTGQQFDGGIQQYYLRARYYDPSNGRFESFDSYRGNSTDPQSFHKYVFTADNPINLYDPSGHFTLNEVAVATFIATVVTLSLHGIYSNAVRSSAAYSQHKYLDGTRSLGWEVLGLLTLGLAEFPGNASPALQAAGSSIELASVDLATATAQASQYLALFTSALVSFGGQSYVRRPGASERDVQASDGNPVRIIGQSSSSSQTVGHGEMIDSLAETESQQPGRLLIFLQRSLRTATGRAVASRDIPDLIVVRMRVPGDITKGIAIDLWEVLSDSQTVGDLEAKLDGTLSQLPRSLRGKGNVIRP